MEMMMGGGSRKPKSIIDADELNESLEAKNNRFEEIKRQQAKNRENFGSGMSSTQMQVYAVFAFFMLATAYIIVQSFRLDEEDAQLNPTKRQEAVVHNSGAKVRDD